MIKFDQVLKPRARLGADVLHKNKYCMNSLQVRAAPRGAALARPLWPAAAFARCAREHVST
jgi:hypothetical protein